MFADGIGLPELLIILVVALLFFGNRLPEVARSLGKSIGEFKKGKAESERELLDTKLKTKVEEDHTKKSTPTT